MAKSASAMISFTTIVTLLILVFTESSFGLVAQYFQTINIIIVCSIFAFVLFILIQHTKLFPKAYYQVGRLTIILAIALAVEGLANYVIGEVGQILSLVITTLVIYVLAWYGYVETHKLKAL